MRNPDYHLGHELVCLTELCELNMRSRAKRAFIRGMQAINPAQPLSLDLVQDPAL
jgi:hypothetical protein